MNRSGSKCAVRGIPSVSGVSRAPCSCSAAPVEGSNCKRPIQCLASSKILTPHPLTAQWVECVPPRLWCGGRTHSLGGEGVGGQYFGRRQTLLCTLHM
jgi:hypothetical protein